MLLESWLILNLWGEAALDASYVQISLPFGNIDCKTPLEMLLDQMPNANKLRIIGCSGHIYLPAEARSRKLGGSSRCRVILEFEKGLYRIWDIQQRRIVGTKHFISDETLLPSRSHYGKSICSVDKASKPSIDNDTEQLPDVK